MDKLPFNEPKLLPLHEYEVWHHGRMIGRTQAVSNKQAVSFVAYRLGLIGHITVAEYESIKAVQV